MALGDSLNNLAGGYQRGQAQFAANEKARQKAAAAGAKAAQDAAEFRLRLATHSQALTNSAEAEYNAIMGEITSDNWDPAKIPALMPRVANFDKTYGAVWGGGSATEMLKKALHLGGGGGQLPENAHGPVDPNAAHPLEGYTSQSQKDAADEKAMKSRTAEAARGLAVQAADYAKSPSGGLPDEATYYRKLYEFQDKAQKTVDANGLPAYDLETLDAAMDILRENAAPYFKGVADQLDQLDKSTARRDAINTRVDEVGRQASAWITSILQLDQQEGGLTGDLFAQRTPVRLKMEQYAQSMAEQGMALGQIKTRIANKFSDEIGGLELDITKTPGMGALTFAGAPVEARNAVDRYFDLNMSPNEARLETFWNPQTGEAWVVDPLSPQDSARVWPPASQGTMPQGVAGTGQPTAPAAAPAAPAAQAPKAAKPPKPEKPKEPEVPVAELMARDPSSLNGVEMARVTSSMTGPDFVRWMVGKGRNK